MYCFTVFLITCATALLMIFEYQEAGVRFSAGRRRFTWGCYVSLGGAGVSLLAALLFICEGCRGAEHTIEQRETARI